MPVTSYPFILEFLTPQTFGPIGQQCPSPEQAGVWHSCPACQTSDDELLENPRNDRVRRSESSPQGRRINKQLCLHRCLQPLFTKTGATCLSNDLSNDLPRLDLRNSSEYMGVCIQWWQIIDPFTSSYMSFNPPPPPTKKDRKKIVVILLLLQVTRHDISEYKEESPLIHFYCWN